MHSADLVPSRSVCRRLVQASLSLAIASTTSLATALPQATSSWALDALDQAAPTLDGVYNPPGDGSGVDIYVLSTGIRATHVEFGARASLGTDVVGGPGAGGDCNGIGTYLASLAGGSNYGVARQANLIDVRVLACLGSGSEPDALSGMTWVANDHVQGAPAVALIPFAICNSTDVLDAIQALIDDDIVVVMAAGGSVDCTCLGALPEEVIVMGALQQDFCPPSILCPSEVDLWAGGWDVPGAWNSSDTANQTTSSYEAPAALAAGVAANFMGLTGLVEPANVKCAMLAAASAGLCTDPDQLRLRDTSISCCQETITLRSGQSGGLPGSAGAPDDSVLVVQTGAAGFPLGVLNLAVPPVGSPASVVNPHGSWTTLADTSARWVHSQSNPLTGMGSPGASVLYAYEFTVTTATIHSAQLNLAWACDDRLGDPATATPQRVGVYLNGQPLSTAFQGGSFNTGANAVQDVTSLLTPGLNSLHFYQYDWGGFGGLIFSGTVTVQPQPDVIMLLSGQSGGVPGKETDLDDEVRAVQVALDPVIGLDPLDFQPASSGSPAKVIRRDGSYLDYLSAYPDARWINHEHGPGTHYGYPARSTLYAYEFTIDTECFQSARIDLSWAADDRLGDFDGEPNEIGVYLNGTALSPDFRGGGIGFETQASHVVPKGVITPGVNTLHFYQRDTNGAWSGLIFGGEITLNPDPVEFFGSGINPAGSLTVVSGSPRIGTTLTFGVDNPIGTQSVGSLPFVALSTVPDPGFPSGTLLPGYGMSAPGYVGELLISLSQFPTLAGPPWAGAGLPAPVAVVIPNDNTFVGRVVYAQGAILDPTPLAVPAVGLTNAAWFVIGN